MMNSKLLLLYILYIVYNTIQDYEASIRSTYIRNGIVFYEKESLIVY